MMPRRRRDGFTLLEASIVLVIIGLVAGMVGSGGWSMIESTRRAGTGTKLDTVENALLAYRLANNSLPCPADASLPNTNANYGVAAANPGSCTGGTPAATFSDATHKVVEGAVPFKTLNLPEEFMYDGWERKFAYAVSQPVTAANAMAGQSLNEMCGISVTDASDVAGNRTKGAVYALVSFGPDGHGGYVKGGTRYNGGVTNADELTNCHCDVNANGTGYAASYVEKDMSLDASDAVHPFSDTVRFKERWQMMSTDDMYLSGSPVCSPGFRIDGYRANEETGGIFVTADINGDGIPDLIIGENNQSVTGNVYVVFGTTSGFPNPLPLNTLNGSNGFVIPGTGATQATNFGWSAAAGDFNKDGHQDILIGDEGDAYIWWGHAAPFSSSEAWGTHISAIGNTYNVAAGDINNDGYADVAYVEPTSNGGKGYLYVIFGNNIPTSGTLTVTCCGAGKTIDGTQGIRLNGTTASYCLGGCSYGGELLFADVNGDGVKDLLVGDGSTTVGGANSSGAVYVVFGHSTSWAAETNINLTALSTAQGAYIWGNTTTGQADGFGNSIAVGNVDGSGADLVVADVNAGFGSAGGHSGSVFIIPVGASFWGSASYDTQTLLAGNKAVHIDGEWYGGQFGNVVAVGDFNKDGYDDIAVSTGFGGAETGYANGVVEVIYGHAAPWTNWDMATTPLNGSNGFHISCSYAVDSGGCGDALQFLDLNGDGTKDLALGITTGSGSGQSQSGYSYVLFGKSGTSWSNPYPLSTIK